MVGVHSDSAGGINHEVVMRWCAGVISLPIIMKSAGSEVMIDLMYQGFALFGFSYSFVKAPNEHEKSEFSTT